MSDNKINVFIQLDMNGKKGTCFNVEKDLKVSDLIEMIKNKEGPQVTDVHLVRAAKPMKATCRLSDYDCYNNCTIFASLSLIGGAQEAEGVSFTSFDTELVKKLGGELAISGKADDGSTMYSNCHYFASNGCGESGCPKAKVGCSCVFCADCMRIHINNTLELGGGITIQCASTGHGNDDINICLLYAVAAYSDDEKSAKDLILSQNYMRQSDSEMHVCPNEKCKKFVHRTPGNLSNSVECTSCHKKVCWSCCGEHTGNGVWCGNANCDPVAVVTQFIELGSMKEISATHGKFQCWSKRLCPNPACSAVNGHSTNCQKIKCTACQMLYCHLCLGLWDKPNGCKYGANCQPKPKQTITKADLPK